MSKTSLNNKYYIQKYWKMVCIATYAILNIISVIRAALIIPTKWLHNLGLGIKSMYDRFCNSLHELATVEKDF